MTDEDGGTTEVHAPGMEQEVDSAFEAMLGVTGSEMDQTKDYLKDIESQDALAELEGINADLQKIKLKAGNYLSMTLTWKDRVMKGDSLEDSQTTLKRLLSYGKSILGLRESFENMPVSQQLNYLFADFQDFVGVLAGIREEVTSKRREADKHMINMRQSLKDAVPRLEEAEKGMMEVQAQREALETKVNVEMSAREKMDFDEEKDLLHESWLAARKELRAVTYVYNLTDNVMETVRVYRQNLDVLIEEADALQHDIQLTANTIKPLMRTVVSGAKIAEALTRGLDSYKILKAVVNPILAKTGEIGAVMPEVRRKVLDGKFIDERVHKHLEECYVRARLVQNYGVMKDLEEARRKLKERGIAVSNFNAEELAFGSGGAAPEPGDDGGAGYGAGAGDEPSEA